jgi:hypothetical protein
MDAYSDERFSQDNDKATQYRTKTVLCFPIKDLNQGSVVGLHMVILIIRGDPGNK